MSTNWRRFEVLLPRQLNDGREVPGEWISEAILEIVDHFGAVSHETQSIYGHWQHGSTLYRDDLARIFVDVRDTAKNRAWMRKFKERWRDRLQQVELWMVSYRIEIH
jgi:hypothetical protein